MSFLRLYKSLFYPVVLQVRSIQRAKPICYSIYRYKYRKSNMEMAEILGIMPQSAAVEKVTPGVGLGAEEGGDSKGDRETAIEMDMMKESAQGSEVNENKGEEVAGKYQVPLSKLSRRAKKRILKQMEWEAKKAGRAPQSKRKKKDEDRVINFTDEMLSDAEYYIEDGLRKVYPYPFNYRTYAKGRWVGQNILDLFDTEFKAYPRSTYEKSINAGRVTVNGQKVGTDYIFKDNDYVENVVHRHELSVTAEPIRIVLETDDLIVVDKPSSIPIHPCGRFRHNSLTYIMAKELGFRNLRTIYRLDRLTSGVFILCKTDKQTQLMQGQIKNREVEKTYVARVVGEFPSERMECREPIDNLSLKIGLFKVGPNGKEALTGFQRLSFNGKTSIVLCKPHTGRTHQIRIHLQYLGFPIENDPLYNTHVWGPNRGKGGDFGKSEEQLVEDILAHHTSSRFKIEHVETRTTENCTTSTASETITVQTNTTPAESSLNTPRVPSTHCDSNDKADGDKSSNQDLLKNPELCETVVSSDDKTNKGAKVDMVTDTRPRFDPTKVTVDPMCDECTRNYLDPKPEELVMYLHALSYSGPGWKYKTELPDWARDDWVPGTGE